ncbi:hypothetical protein ACERII_06070 [Evansella sp. AB-rgal1]|uniref:hypothetical protein n=1 Tax=Evansella sp. AB-rgal1 TaxID=3242696 RepID=UPI00359DCE1C
MNTSTKTIWILGNILLGVFTFIAFLWGVLTAWGSAFPFWFYPIAAVSILFGGYILFNSFLIKNKDVKLWGISLFLFLTSTAITIIVHVILQNTIFD